MKKIFAVTTITLLCSTLFFIPQLAKYELNKNKEYVESIIQDKIQQKVVLGDFDLSFTNITISSINISSKNNYALTNVSANINLFNIFTGDYFNLVSGIKIDNIKIEREEDNSPVDIEDIKNKIIATLPTFKYINSVQIKYLEDKNITITEFNLNKSNENYLFNSVINYIHNDFNINGSLNFNKLLTTNKLDANITIQTNNFKLPKINQFIDNQNFSILNGTLDSTQHIVIKDNDLSISGENNTKDFQFVFVGKNFNVKNVKTNNNFHNKNFEINILSNLIVNNVLLDIKKIQADADESYQNIKNITVKSDKLNYSGQFSQNFNQNKKTKEIKINFNIIDLNYLIKLGLISNIPTPYNNTIINNGTFIINLTKEKGSDYKVSYTANGDTKLKVGNYTLSAKTSLINNKLFFENIAFNDKQQNGTIQYGIDDDSLDLDLKLDMDQSLFNYAKEQYHLPFNINLTKNTIGINLKLSQLNKKYNYSGFFNFKNNDLSIEYTDKPFFLTNLNGVLDFETFKLKLFNVKIDNIHQDDNQINDVILSGTVKNNLYNILLNNEFFTSRISYNANNDNLDINIPLIDYNIKHNQKIKEAIEKNAQDIAMLKKLKFPEKVNIHIGNLDLNDYDLGKIDFSSTRKEHNTYDIISSLITDTAQIKLATNLNLENLTLNNNINISSDDLEKFNKAYHFDNVIKHGNLKALGEFKTNITSLDIDTLIKQTEGNMSIISENGEFTRINTGVGFFLNFLNFNTIPNLAKLDFKHVFTDKLSYESMKMNAHINGTDLNIDQFKINSGISNIDLNGLVDFENQNLNLNLQVTPKISSTLLFIASVANPIALVSSTLIQKILPISPPELIKYHYKVIGKITDPKLEKK